MAKFCKCGKEIPEGRLKALPNATTCVECSTSEKKAGFRIISGKTEYSELQIVSQETFQKLTKAQARKGQSPGAGIRMGGH
jgi:RNA polymerase-binding transcription factor DksA